MVLGLLLYHKPNKEYTSVLFRTHCH